LAGTREEIGLRSGEGLDTGQIMHDFITELFPLFRSITGEGLRETLQRIGRHIALQIAEVASGTQVLDWNVPPEWTVRSARLETLDCTVIADIQDSNLHLLQYSQPIDRIVTLDELKAHLYTLPEHPEWIPYRTAYYTETWGFCLTDRVAQGLVEPAYHVRIDTDVTPGSLSYGECLLPGADPDEFLISVHTCHPSLANDNLSGIAVATELARRMAANPHRLTYRFLFIPGTIGSITWLALNRDKLDKIRHGLVLSGVGDQAPMTYKQSRRGTAQIDRIAAHVLGHHGGRVSPFVPWGYDERQYCSPGFDLPVGCLMRSPNGSYPEYHTSADNLDLVQPAALADSLARLEEIIEIAEADGAFLNTAPFGEPQLGARGLYKPIGGLSAAGDQLDRDYDTLALLWVLNQSDGRHSLLDIAEAAHKPFREICAAAVALARAGLLTPAAA
jgi:aminopeptidase-like protein